MSTSPLHRRLFFQLLGERRTTRRGGRRASDHEPMNGWYPALLLGLAIATVDWGTKMLVSANVALGEFRPFVGDSVALWHVRNDAMMLGLWSNLPLAGRQAIAIAAAVVAAVFLVQIMGRGHRLGRGERPWAWSFVGLVIGGMLGNLGERAVHWGVTDFLSFRWGDIWLPPGNVADVALFLSMAMAVPVALFEIRGRMRRRPVEAGGEAAASAEMPTGAADPA